MYHSIILAEEEYLRGKVRRRVRRLLPARTALVAALSRFGTERSQESDFHWARVFVKEYSAPLGWVLPVVGFGLYNMKQTGELADQPLRTGVLLCGAGRSTVLFWLTAGYLKKTRSPVFRTTDGSRAPPAS